MYYCKKTRRQFLMGMKGFSLALPFLPSLLSRSVLAAVAGGRSKRFISVFHGNGTEVDRFWPNNIPMSNMNGRQQGTLTNSNQIISEILGSPFNSLKQKTTIIRGLARQQMETNGHGHNPMICLTGCNVPDHNGKTGKYIGRYSAWPSLDQVFANSNVIYPQAPTVRSLHLLTRRPDVYTTEDRERTVSFKSVGGKFVGIPHEKDPRVTFDRLFGGQTMSLTSRQPTNAFVKSPPAFYKKVVDKVYENYVSLRSNKRISKEDKVALEVHMSHLNDLEKTLISNPPPVEENPESCPKQTRPGSNRIAYRERAVVDAYVSSQIDLIVAAIRCQMTNVATLMLNTPTDDERFPFLGGYRNYTFHQESHYGQGENGSPGSRSNHIIEIHKWFASKMAELATKLDVAEANGATYLDNSLIVLSNTQGAGNHTGTDIPTVLIGSAGGKIKTNQYIRYNNPIAYNQLLVTVAQAMGLSPSQYNQGGRRGFGTYRNASSASDTPLPGVLV